METPISVSPAAHRSRARALVTRQPLVNRMGWCWRANARTISTMSGRRSGSPPSSDTTIAPASASLAEMTWKSSTDISSLRWGGRSQNEQKPQVRLQRFETWTMQ